ncbi:S49 family peptidase [Methylocystis rosea]|uniref:S49 family peptidase n=2 Tax=Methylocystis rosea TaxID=173366 RepID=A0A3G8MBF2_9HYPH|nr:S49 family peptidase [Methylocystis rosea]
MVISSVISEHMTGVAPLVDVENARAEAQFERETHSQMLDRFDGEPRGPRVKNAYGDSYIQTRYRFRKGVALITVEGSLVNRGAYIGAASGLTSYEGVTAQFAAAAADPDVKTIMLDLDSPGGEAGGAFELADFVHAVAQEKPVVAIVNALAASAAYAMASGASRIITTPSGVSGSIGVVVLHLDQSKRLEKMGVVPTLIYAGGHKVDGNPFEPLPEDTRADLQAEVDQLYAMFVATVARGRSNLTEDAIRATEARTCLGAEAVEIGLADDVGTFVDIAEELQSSGMGRKFMKGATMSQADLKRSPSVASGGEPRLETTPQELSGAVLALFPDSKRAQAFGEALSKGASIALAADLAKMIDDGQSTKMSPLQMAMAQQRRADLGPGGGPAPHQAAAKDDLWAHAIATVNREFGRA